METNRLSTKGYRLVFCACCCFFRSRICLCHIRNPSSVSLFLTRQKNLNSMPEIRQKVYDPDKGKSYTKAKAAKCRRKAGNSGYMDADLSLVLKIFLLKTVPLRMIFRSSGVCAHRYSGPFERMWQSNKEINTW